MNNPLFLAALGSIVRWLLTMVSGIFVAHGIWVQTDADVYVTQLAAFIAASLATLAWSLFHKINVHDLIERIINLPAGVDPRIK